MYLTGKISSFHEETWTIDPDKGMPISQIEFLESLPGGKIPKFSKERNLDRIDRIITGDENLWKSYFHWYNYGLGKMTNEMDFTSMEIRKAKTAALGYHLQVNIPEGILQFRYSTQVDPKGRFAFPRYLDPLSKINHDKDVTHYVFATPEVRYIIDYQKLKKNMPCPPMIQEDFDGLFHLTDLIHAGCVMDILKLKLGENGSAAVAYQTCESEIRIHQFMRRYLNLWKILPAGIKERHVVVVAFQVGKAIHNLSRQVQVIDGKKTLIPRPFRSIREAFDPIDAECRKRAKVAAYRSVAQQSKTFGEAFEKFKSSGDLPRVLPLYKLSETEFVAVVSFTDVKTEDYKRFEKAILTRLEQKAKQKPRKKKSVENPV